MTDSRDLEIWGIALNRTTMTDEDIRYLQSLPEEIPPNEWVWAEMDRVWDSFGLDNSKPLGEQPIGDFYSHPVWLMNGVFSAVDPTSATHRQALARYIAASGATDVADYGGGFGELALQIIRERPATKVTIVEPYPSAAALDRLQHETQIHFVATAAAQTYDLMLAQDVLEHVEEPIDLAIDLAQAVRAGGTLVFANNFTPVIKCHLPSTFHLQHTFRAVMTALGLRYEGRVEGADHAHIYTVGGTLHPGRARTAAKLSGLAGPALDLAAKAVRKVKRRQE